MDDPIQNQINFIKELLKLGKLQQNSIEGKGKSQLYVPKDCAQRITMILHTEKLYVENFWNTVEFLNAKLQEDEDKNFSFYFPLTRTSTEIYAELLYLTNQDEKKGYGICVAQFLFQLSKRYIDTERQINNGLEKLYKSYYKEVNAGSLNLPENIGDFSKKRLEKSSFDFPGIEQIIKNHLDIDKMATNTKQIFPKLTNDKIYNLHYKVPSDYLHGKIYSLTKSGRQQNEKFWIISHCEIISFLFIELVDKKILNKETEKEIKTLAEKFKNNCGNFKDLWIAKRKLCRTLKYTKRKI